MSPDGSDVRKNTYVAATDEDPQSDRGSRRTDSDLYSMAPDRTGLDRLTTSPPSNGLLRQGTVRLESILDLLADHANEDV
jgi:hypothetical protein